MSNLLRKPHKGQSCLHQITPADAGWHYVGFGVYDLASGQLLSDVVQMMRYALCCLAAQRTLPQGT